MITTEDLMTLDDLYQWVREKITKDPSSKYHRVCIPNNKVGIAGTSVTYLKDIGGGIDWDRSKIFLYPEKKMIESDQVPILDWKEKAMEWANKQMPKNWDKTDVNQVEKYYSYVFMFIRDACSIFRKHL